MIHDFRPKPEPPSIWPEVAAFLILAALVVYAIVRNVQQFRGEA